MYDDDERRRLIYGSNESQSADDSTAQFQVDEFLAEHPADWRPFLQQMTATQSFSQFIDERVSDLSGHRDVVYFDESIDAKLNRYTFRTKTLDTPFLLNEAHKHSRTFVAPSPDLSGLGSPSAGLTVSPEDGLFLRLRPGLYSPPRKLTIPFDPNQLHFGLLSNRLKRITAGGGSTSALSPAACIHSVYLVTLGSSLVSTWRRRTAAMRAVNKSVASTSRLLDEFAGDFLLTGPERRRRSSVEESPPTVLLSDSQLVQEAAALRLGLRTAFEALDCLTRLDSPPGEFVYRTLLDACACSGDLTRAVDLLVYMSSEGLVPDRQMLNHVIRAHAQESRSLAPGAPSYARKLSSAEILTVQDWRMIREQIGESSLPPISLLLRRSAPFNSSAAAAGGKSSLVDLLFGLPEASAGSIKTSPPTSASASSASSPQPPGPDELLLPCLQWTDLAATAGSGSVHSSSKKLGRLMRHSEKLLAELFPRLAIDLQHPLGFGCPNRFCSLGRPLTVSEAFRGFKPDDINNYTTRCVHCQTLFVPRFAVWLDRRHSDTEPDLWCELLSPWTLRKEVYTILFQEGVDDLLSASNRLPSSPRSVLFWNSIVSFRLLGLPYSFFLTEGSVSRAFPAA